MIDILQRGRVAVAAVKGYSQRAGETARAAMAEASKRGQPNVAPEHLLLALLGDRRSVAATALTALGTDLEAVRQRLEQFLPSASGHVADDE